MRVIGGQFRSRPLVAPAGTATRPTSDRLRETLFNVLSPRIAGSYFADLYAGSGAVGIEALSRGVEQCFFAEQAPVALAAMRRNLQALSLSSASVIEPRPVRRALEEAGRQQRSFNIVFLDPPYEDMREYTATLSTLGEQGQTLLRDAAVVIAEHARRSPLQESYGALRRTRLLEQGDAALSFYALEER